MRVLKVIEQRALRCRFNRTPELTHEDAPFQRQRDVMPTAHLLPSANLRMVLDFSTQTVADGALGCDISAYVVPQQV